MQISLIVFLLIVLLLIIVSVRERVKWQSMRNKNWDVLGDPKSSPLSQAITGMVGTAGGIYLSLIILQAFLELHIPKSIQISGISLEPLATLSIVLAIIQPFAMRLWLGRRF
ncbi:hypothetical protein SPSYN_02360 [Sporotomaculum syntrophicum]|uniref:Uncharacterized protein n=1 Tax=Sporotomaculum syntrophicum TaxID=182264 RepID=A0A9D3AX32_9FIRM|nr:hypothetical protein [Sporotomaculum syntrophicum]KAF1084582.1 hypothetical protein SPSYN_02360 [Sporotomaculum syntrophicum]